ncbi:MAG TPA: HAD-IB family hydrolase [Acidimicrobiales bacterium]|nr:HAD-IB family hydrolase [Acidimicrobiales bacterium]
MSAGPPTTAGAFFDLDKTVIAKASVVAFSRPLYKEGLLSRRILARGLWAQLIFLRFGAGPQALERMRLGLLEVTQGWEQEHVRRIIADTLVQVVAPITYKEAVDLIEEHKRQGRRVYIVSAAPEEIVEPLARYVGADEAIGSRAVVNAGRYTGQMVSYAYGPKKAEAIRLIAARDGLDLSESWAYSDSATDLPMLEAVGHPVAVNPERALRRIAQMRNWPIERFEELTVLTPNGNRPLRLGLVGLAGAVALGTAVTVVALVTRRWHANKPAATDAEAALGAETT